MKKILCVVFAAEWLVKLRFFFRYGPRAYREISSIQENPRFHDSVTFWDVRPGARFERHHPNAEMHYPVTIVGYPYRDGIGWWVKADGALIRGRFSIADAGIIPYNIAANIWNERNHTTAATAKETPHQ